ncbi:glycosyl hydrolase [Mucilaginibacter sp. PPCGB 2223]|uniref:glycoside hydrolase family 30 protein n=1 Tax=Mucilaginibacter sp. PPCGB 2223 TaxID=1886027 RepID=UPI000826F147|nr:glycoside hydrolase family 30 protein [Mucilaginibacter sp. PPCGB 2223]OCX52324.1 glycosyl hydrolase [Mucilaginibacter sp. PPCGB 2223]
MKKYLILSLAIGCFLQAQAQHHKVTVYVSARGTDHRLSKTETLDLSAKGQTVETEVAIFVDPNKKFQTLIGIGGALTDAAAETFYKLPADKQKEFLTAYYDTDKGIGYTWGRTNMQSCDFSSDMYSYVQPGDKDLKTFDISHDKKYRIPFIKAVDAVTGGKLKLFISPWSPPAFMKTNNDVLHGGKLLPEYDQSWATFFTKYIKAYEKEGIKIFGLTVQNEPMATQKWESCIFTATEERDFVKNYLGPTLQKAGLADKKLMVWDHNRDLVYDRASTILEDPAAAKYVWGVGYHWYETWTGAGMAFENTRRVAEAFPGKHLVFTEGCAESFNMDRVNEWSLGEKYGYSMINDLNIGTVAWTDWNVLLDEKGGPNHVGNYCFSPIIADTRNGSLIYTSEYYYIGHLSKYIRPGAKRIAVSASRDKLLTTAFQNPDGKIAVVVMNSGDAAIPYSLLIKGQGAAITALPHSIATLVID